MPRVSCLVGAAIVLCVLSASQAGAKPWTLKETNFGDRRLVVLVQWTENGGTVGVEPIAELDPGESKEFKPPKGATDWVQTRFFRTGDPKKDTLHGIVLKETHSFDIGDIADVVDQFVTGTELLIPDPVADNLELFAAVDLAVYLPQALTSLPGPLQIVDGRSPLLPGFLIGTTDVTFDHALGFVTDSPFSGIALFDSAHSIVVGESLPEPGTSILVVTGLAGLALRRRRGAKTPPS